MHIGSCNFREVNSEVLELVCSLSLRVKSVGSSVGSIRSITSSRALQHSLPRATRCLGDMSHGDLQRSPQRHAVVVCSTCGNRWVAGSREPLVDSREAHRTRTVLRGLY